MILKKILSYVDAFIWVQENYDPSVSYSTLRTCMIGFLGSKIKSPRKSHIKKLPEAKADFLKLT